MNIASQVDLISRLFEHNIINRSQALYMLNNTEELSFMFKEEISEDDRITKLMIYIDKLPTVLNAMETEVVESELV